MSSGENNCILTFACLFPSYDKDMTCIPETPEEVFSTVTAVPETPEKLMPKKKTDAESAVDKGTFIFNIKSSFLLVLLYYITVKLFHVVSYSLFISRLL